MLFLTFGVFQSGIYTVLFLFCFAVFFSPFSLYICHISRCLILYSSVQNFADLQVFLFSFFLMSMCLSLCTGFADLQLFFSSLMSVSHSSFSLQNLLTYFFFFWGGGFPPPPAPPPLPLSLMSVCLSLYSLCRICLPAAFSVFLSFLCLYVSFFILSAGFADVQLFCFVCLLSPLYLCLILHSQCRIY